MPVLSLAKSTRVKLADRFVKSATTDGRKSPIFMDDEVIGFGVQVRETGGKSFTLDYMFKGRRRRFFISDFPDRSTNAAREHAAGLTAFAALHESESGSDLAIVGIAKVPGANSKRRG